MELGSVSPTERPVSVFPRKAIAEQGLQLAQLVVAAAQRHQVVALDEQPRAAQRAAQRSFDPPQRLDRRDAIDQANPLIAVDCGFLIMTSAPGGRACAP